MLSQDKYLKYRRYGGSIGMCYKYGIFIAQMNHYPVMNMFVTNEILQRLIDNNELKEWMPA